MKKNKKRPQKMSVCTSRFVQMSAVVLTLFVVLIINIGAVSQYQKLQRDCGATETKLKKLQNDLERETGNWEKMKTTESLEKALMQHGLSMHYPKPSQNIRMKNGKPISGQLSIAKATQREKGLATASYRSTINRKR